MIVRRQNRQSILDLCIEHTGSIESLVDVMELNNQSALDIEIEEVIVPDPIKPSVVSFFASSNHSPATHEETGGIDYDPRDYNMNDYY